MKNQYEAVSAKCTNWGGYIPAVAEAVQEKGIEGIGLLYDRVIDFLMSGDQDASSFIEKINKKNFRDTLMGRTHPYAKDTTEEMMYTPAAVAVAAFLGKDIEDLFGDIPEKDFRIKVEGKTQRISRENAVDFFGEANSHICTGTDRPAIDAELKNHLTHAIDQLTDREKNIISLLYGLGNAPAMTCGQVGAVYSVTAERIRQIEARGLRKLRHPSNSHVLRAFVDDDTAVEGRRMREILRLGNKRAELAL